MEYFWTSLLHWCSDYLEEHIGELHFGWQWSVLCQLMFPCPFCACVVIGQHCGGWFTNVDMPVVVHWPNYFRCSVLKQHCSCRHNIWYYICNHNWIELEIFQFDQCIWWLLYLWWKNMNNHNLDACCPWCIWLTLCPALFDSCDPWWWPFNCVQCAVLHFHMLGQSTLGGILV